MAVLDASMDVSHGSVGRHLSAIKTAEFRGRSKHLDPSGLLCSRVGMMGKSWPENQYRQEYRSGRLIWSRNIYKWGWDEWSPNYFMFGKIGFLLYGKSREGAQFVDTRRQPY